jgi:hypothetical protein
MYETSYLGIKHHAQVSNIIPKYETSYPGAKLANFKLFMFPSRFKNRPLGTLGAAARLKGCEKS